MGNAVFLGSVSKRALESPGNYDLHSTFAQTRWINVPGGGSMTTRPRKLSKGCAIRAQR